MSANSRIAIFTVLPPLRESWRLDVSGTVLRVNFALESGDSSGPSGSRRQDDSP
jgi:hypothetical protein